MAKFLDPSQNALLGARYSKAMLFAFNSHYRQVRKGQIECPYISHLLAVSGLVLEAGGNEDEAIAALLHDAVEDAGVSLQDIEVNFGAVVASIVSEVSEDKSIPEPERKRAYIDSVFDMSPSALRVSIADKLHNIRCYSVDRELFGDKQKEFYMELLLEYSGVNLDDALTRQVKEILEILKALV